MKTKIIVFFLLALIYLSTYNEELEVDKKTIEPVAKVINTNNEELEDYVVGVVACEMPALFEEEALKAMSVAARTYAMYKLKSDSDYDLYNSDSDQCYINQEEMKDKWSSNYEKYFDKITDIVSKTKGEYLTYNDEVIIAFYFSITNGYTENVQNVFGEKLSYLESVKSPWDSEYSYKEASTKFELKDFLSKLKIEDSKINNIEIKKNDSNRVDIIKINNKEYKGTEFRKLLNLKSTDISIKCDDSEVIVYTKGYGHGVGMSQYGANGMAKEGYTYDEILKYYYSGVEIMNN